jgi:hypothetical protein
MTKLHEAAAAPGRKIVTVRRKFYFKTKKSHRRLLYASFLPILQIFTKKRVIQTSSNHNSRPKNNPENPQRGPKQYREKKKEPKIDIQTIKKLQKESTGTTKAPDPERKSCNLSPTFTSILDAHQGQQKRKERTTTRNPNCTAPKPSFTRSNPIQQQTHKFK